MIKISIRNQYPDFKSTVFFNIIKNNGRKIVEVSPDKADIVIYGPFGRDFKAIGPIVKRYPSVGPKIFRFRKTQPINIFHTIENVRHDDLYDFSVGYDYSTNEKNFRFPYWMESIDWTHEGVDRSNPLRISKYIKIQRLLEPLGMSFKKRNMRCAAFFGQMREPRRQMYNQISKVIPVDGFGKAFDFSIKNSQSSGNFKDLLLLNYSYNLAPENALYPGYYTEKILESFASGCIALGWADQNIKTDFNTNSFINLLQYSSDGYDAVVDELNNKINIDRLASSSLLKESPTIEPMREFVHKILSLV